VSGGLVVADGIGGFDAADGWDTDDGCICIAVDALADDDIMYAAEVERTNGDIAGKGE